MPKQVEVPKQVRASFLDHEHNCHHLLIINRYGLSLFAKELLRKAMRCWFYERTTPILVSDASHSIMNGCVKSGRARTCVEARACLRAEKVAFAVEYQWKFPFFNRPVKGWASRPKLR